MIDTKKAYNNVNDMIGDNTEIVKLKLLQEIRDLLQQIRDK